MCPLISHQKLLSDFREFSNIDYVGKVADLFRPKFIEISNKYDEFYVDMEDLKICIANLDHNLSQKVNKSMMPVIEEQLKNNFLPRDSFEALKG